MDSSTGQRPPAFLNHNGFTYMTAMILMVVTGIALIGVSRYWRMIIQRDLEAELLFRGAQIRKGIESYYKAGKDNYSRYPMRLEDLLKDPRFSGTRRHLRTLYKEPFSKNGKWRMILGNNGRLKGVHSKSSGKPLKTRNFSSENAKFKKAEKYSDWKFIYEPPSLSKNG
jgi:type II secretory pathway pseudopilin PulG